MTWPATWRPLAHARRAWWRQRQKDQRSELSVLYLFCGCYVTRWGKFGRVFCKQTNVAARRFQNECNKVEIALRVVQFWSEIKLVITNRTPASRSCDFVITRLISDQIALHSVQLPLFITFILKSMVFPAVWLVKNSAINPQTHHFECDYTLITLSLKIQSNERTESKQLISF